MLRLPLRTPSCRTPPSPHNRDPGFTNAEAGLGPSPFALPPFLPSKIHGAQRASVSAVEKRQGLGAAGHLENLLVIQGVKSQANEVALCCNTYVNL